MAKKSLINVWQWWDLKLLQHEIPSSEQLLIFHLIRLLNKTFWSPAQISINKFAAEMKCDKRTVKKALDAVIEKGLVISTKNGYLLNIEDTQNVIYDNEVKNEENADNGKIESKPKGTLTFADLLAREGLSDALTSPRS